MLAALGTAAALFTHAPPAIAAPPSLVEELERVEAGALPLCPLPPDRRPLGRTIAELAAQLRAAMNAPAGGDDAVRALNDLVFKNLAIRPSPDLHDPCNLLPSAVLVRKQGYCVGIAALYLALAEHLDLPIRAVATPSHVFLRFDDGKTRINIETLRSGAPLPDDYYVSTEKVAPASIRRGVFLRDLTPTEFVAEIHNNLGVVYSERAQLEAAERQYRRALAHHRDLPAARYNWGNDLLRWGEYRRAIRAFTRCLNLHPNDVWALNNRGMAYIKVGKTERARRDFEEALRIEPGFEQARLNLQGLSTTQ